MIQTQMVEVNGYRLLGIKIQFPSVPLLLLMGTRGIAACGYINFETADRLNDPIIIVSGVKDFNDMINAEIKYVTKSLEQAGIKAGTKLYECISKIA